MTAWRGKPMSYQVTCGPVYMRFPCSDGLIYEINHGDKRMPWNTEANYNVVGISLKIEQDRVRDRTVTLAFVFPNRMGAGRTVSGTRMDVNTGSIIIGQGQ